MKIINIALVTLITMSGLTAYAGGAGGNGGPPAKEAETDLLEGGGSLILDGGLKDLDKNPVREDILNPLKPSDLIKGLDGKILIPLTPDQIRRMELRTSAGGIAPLTVGSQRFNLQRDALRAKLVDLKKAAEVVERESINLPSEE